MAALAAAWREVHCARLPSPAHVYSLAIARFSTRDGPCLPELWVVMSALPSTPEAAAVRFFFEPAEGEGGAARPCLHTVKLPGIPDKADVASVYALPATAQAPHPRLMIACVEDDASYSEVHETLLVLYNVDLAAGTLVFQCARQLDYGPFFLREFSLTKLRGEEETQVLALSGSDQRLHAYEATKDGIAPSPPETELPIDPDTSGAEPTDKPFVLRPPQRAFLEQHVLVDNLPSCAIAMDEWCEGDVKISIAGCQGGELMASCAVAGEPSWRDSVRFEGPVTSVTLFSHQAAAGDSQPRPNSELMDIHLLVTLAAESAVVYTHIFDHGLGTPVFLSDSDKHDSVLCAAVDDLSSTGCNEIVIGAYGRRLLFYSLTAVRIESEEDPGLECALRGTRELQSPVYAVSTVDMLGSGRRNLVVLTKYSLHVFERTGAKTTGQQAQG